MAAKAKQKSITEEIPEVLRNAMPNPEILTSLLPAYLTDLSLEEAIHFINGAIEHQQFVNDDEASGWFKFTLDEVEEVDRWIGGEDGPKDKKLGTKLRLHFQGQKYKSTKMEAQSIDTGWLDFQGWGRDQFSWEMALANTLKEIAEGAIGKTVLAQKIVYDTDDGPARYLGNLRVLRDQDGDDDSGGNRGSSKKRSGGGKSGAYGSKSEVKDRIMDAVDDLDPDENMTEEDITFLKDLFKGKEMTDGDIWEHIAEYLDGDLKNPKDESDDQIIWAVQVIVENI